MIGTKKIAGILTESSIRGNNYCAIIGFGVNVNNSYVSVPSTLRNKVTSLYDLIKSRVNVEWLMQENLKEFVQIYTKMFAGRQAEIVTEWKRLTLMLGKQITVCEGDTSFKAVAVDLDSDGALVVRTENGALRRLLSASILL